MIRALRIGIYKHGYLLIAAAWLYTISFIVTNYFTYSSSPERIKQTLEEYLRKEEDKVRSIATDSVFLNDLISSKPKKQKVDLTKESFGLFIYQKNKNQAPAMVYWNSFIMSVNQSDVIGTDSVYTVKYQNGFFELVRHPFTINNNPYALVAMIPIHWDYFIENKYLQKEFAGYPDIEKLYSITGNPANATPIHNSYGKIVYYITPNHASFDQPNSFSIILRVIAILLTIAFVNATAKYVAEKESFGKAFIYLISIIVVVRFITYKFSFPFNFRRLELFDPSIYASNALHPSLGDLLINAFLAAWIANFIKFNWKPLLDENVLLPSRKGKILAIVSLVSLPPFTFFIAEILTSLVTNSKIPFDVTNFFNLNIYTFTSFVVIGLMILFYFHFTQILLIPSYKAGFSYFFIVIVTCAVSLIIITFSYKGLEARLNLLVLIWLIIYLSILNVRKRDVQITLTQSPFFLFWVFLFCVAITSLIVIENKNVELQQRKRMAEKLALQTDPSGEQLMKFGIASFNDDDFLEKNFFRFKSENTNKSVKDSLIASNFSGYLNKYDTRIYVYNKHFYPLYNDDSTSYHVWNATIDMQGKTTSIPDLYYYENISDLFSYIYEKAITASNNKKDTLGYFLFIAKPKKYKSEALFPELFKQVNDPSSDMNNYAYAVYSNGNLLNNFNDYPFPNVLTLKQHPKTEFEIRKVDNFDELWYQGADNKIIVIAKRDNLLIESITFFAYLFCVAFITIALFHIGSFMLRSRFKWKNIKQIFRFNIRTQIHATIIFVSIFSFVVIGITTISFFIVRFDNTNEERLKKAIQVMSSEISLTVNQMKDDQDIPSIFNDIGRPGSDIDKKIIETSEVHNVDVNLYNTYGDLVFSTQPNIYNKRIFSSKMEPQAFYNMYYNRLVQYMQNEQVANFTYESIYSPVKDINGKTYAYINIPYLNSQSELNQEISSFLVTLINLNAFVFVFAGAIALLVTNRITASFTIISNKMKKISLERINEEIEWNRDDEIGVLVNEYNKMVQKLEESAEWLAQSEREGAWREMARQVAHEIKNPLTPMKLGIQYLQKAINEDSPNVKQLSQQIATTLIEQINQLSKIAGDFSQFANIGNEKLEKFDLCEVLNSLIGLHNIDANIDIVSKIPEEKVYLYADKHHINRLFTNLIKNAIEASDSTEHYTIEISLNVLDESVLVAVKDFGHGIPVQMQPRIFTPNFTTKSSGTGLGLAICKGIVEKARGQIWFITEVDKGSVFFVSLPLFKEANP